MKDQGKAQPKRRELVGRNEFPPFKRNQIRWALHCYRWKEGISWEKYPYVIAHVLGLKELGEGLNSRDPRGFVLEGQTPTPEKLRLYERFIEAAAPEYAKALSKDEFMTSFADFLGRYMNPDWETVRYDDSHIENGENLEQFVYFEPCPGIAKFETSTSAWISVFRRIGKTPYFKMLSVTIDNAISVDNSINVNVGGQDAAVLRHKISFYKILEMEFDDTLIISGFWKGIAVPFSNDQCYLAILEDQTKRKNVVQLCPCAVATTRTVRNNWKTDYTYAKASVEAPCMHSFLFRAQNSSGFAPSMEESVMLGLEHEAARHFFSTMDLNA